MKQTDTADMTRSRQIRTAACIALFGNLFLMIIKLVFGKISGSLAVLGDGIDSATDVGIALMTIIISTIISRPGDAEHPWGHGRAETTATMILSFIIFFAGAQLALSAVQQIASKNISHHINYLAVIASLISIGGKTILAFSQYRIGKKCESEIVLANAQNMKNDILMSSSVLIGIGSSELFSLPILDSVTALLVSIWVIKNSLKLFMEINQELMDGNNNRGMYKKLFDAAISVPGVTNPHRARIRKIASRWDIDLDIEVNADIRVHEAHFLAEQVEKAVRNSIPDIYDIMVHIEPAGHSKHHPKEQYGLSEKDIPAS